MKASIAFKVGIIAVVIAVMTWDFFWIYSSGVAAGRAECFKEQVELLHRSIEMDLGRVESYGQERATAGTVEL